jgi:hypothetical protein
LEAINVKEAVEEHLFCGALIDNSPASAVTEGFDENLEEECGPEFAALFSKEQDLPLLLFTPKTKRSQVHSVSNLFLLLWNLFKQVKTSPKIYSSL